jgi:hypothetical protein
MSAQLHRHILVVYHLHPGDIPFHPVGLELILLPVGQKVVDRVLQPTRKYKRIYDMQASRRKATRFNMQKSVVNNYALGILVLRSQHLHKVLTSIASWSLTVTDPQPNKIHFDKPTQPNPGFPLIM